MNALVFRPHWAVVVAGTLLALIAAHRSTAAGEPLRVSVSATGVQGDGHSHLNALAAHGQYIAFRSAAKNLVPGDTNGEYDIFVRSAQLDTTIRVSVNTAGTQGNKESGESGLDITPDGRFVAFSSKATNLVGADANAKEDIFVRDRDTDANGLFEETGMVATVRVSVATDGSEANDGSFYPSFSANGRYVAFASYASNLVANDTNISLDIFVRDRDTDANGVMDETGKVKTTRVNVTSAGVEADGGVSSRPTMSADGRYVAFTSNSANLNTQNGYRQIFVHDRDTDANGVFDEAGKISTTMVSVNGAGDAANYDCWAASLSANGRGIAIVTYASNLVANDTNNEQDIFVRTLPGGTMVRASVATDGTEADSSSNIYGSDQIAFDGRFVVFESIATGLVANDTNRKSDIFVRDRDTDRNGVMDEAGKVATFRVSLNKGNVQGNDASGDAAICDGGFVAFRSKATNLVPNDTNARDDTFLYPIDADNDWLPDLWETRGVDFDLDGTVDLTLTGAKFDHKDLYVEADAMTDREPTAGSITEIVNAYAGVPNALVGNPDGANGIAMHLDLDEVDIARVPWPNAFTNFYAVKLTRFGTPAQRANAQTIAAKRLTYRYTIFAQTYGGGTSSGLAEGTGNDFMITLGGFATPGGTARQREVTFIHELGHTLGLEHGGDQEDAANRWRFNLKPNYHSAMNYQWQMPSGRAGWALDYSREAFPNLNETALNEAAGIGGHMGHEVLTGPLPARESPELGAVDWDRDGVAGNNVSVASDVNRVRTTATASPGDVLHGYADWPNLRYRIGGGRNFVNGASDVTTEGDEMTYEDYYELDALAGSTTTSACPQPTPGMALLSSQVNICIRNDSPYSDTYDYVLRDTRGWLVDLPQPTSGAVTLEIGEQACFSFTLDPPGGCPEGEEDSLYWSVVPRDGPANGASCATTFGCGSPTPTLLALFDAEPVGDAVELRYRLAAESGATGVHLYRAEASSPAETRLTSSPIALDARDEYTFLDRDVRPGLEYRYGLGLVLASGTETRLGSTRVVTRALEFALGRPHPNPASADFTVTLSMPRAGHASLRVFDLNGRLVRTLHEGALAAGVHPIRWNAEGARVESGIYFIVFEALGRTARQRVVIAR